MASLSSHPTLFSRNLNHNKPFHFFSANPSLISFPLKHPRRGTFSFSRQVPDEWGEKSDPQPEPASKPDPTRLDDEWENDPPTVQITDEWGEKTDLEPEPASEPDPTQDDDEWGGGAEPASEASVPEPESEADKERLEDLKSCLVDTFYGTNYGLNASSEVRAEIFELVSQLEAENPTVEPNCSEFLDGNWILLYTAFSELLPLIAIGNIPLLKVDKISQAIDTKGMTIINATTLLSPFATISFSAAATFDVRSPSRIQIQFKEGAFQPPEISSSINLPENIEIFGQKINLSPIQQSLNPLQEAVANIARSISGQPPLKVPIPGERTASWLLTTYLDNDLRISRGDGGLFVLAKEGSTLLDQLS